MSDASALAAAICANYVDGNNLVTPNPCLRSVLRGSDNGAMYESEYVIIMKRLGCPVSLTAIDACISPDTGLLQRIPCNTGKSDQEGPDNMYGVLNAFKQCGQTQQARGFLIALVKYFGCFNNTNPGQWTAKSFLIRQLQLLAAIVTVAFPSLINPLHWLIRLLIAPLYVYSAIVIGISCIGVDKGSTDPRRLSWHLVQILKDRSLLCWLASKIWYRRLYRDYGLDGMKAVARIYYKGLDADHPHPFAQYPWD